jgi:alkanesulfonate monooxygenase SsuD/methylene tetrahydromethanopterin reductase-like flavin-dependent oxidoreductase (luciferase family)
MPPRTVVPRPVQTPHPPLWVGGVGPGNAERAAKSGLGMLFFANNTAPEALRESVTAYKEHIGSAVPFVPGGVNDQVAGFVNVLCTDNPADRDRIRWLAATKFVEHTLHGSIYMTRGWPDDEQLPPSYAHVSAGGPRTLRDAITADPDAVARGLLESNSIAAGTPDDVLSVLTRFQGVGVDQVIMHMQMGGIGHDDIMRSISVLGGEVIPKLR